MRQQGGAGSCMDDIARWWTTVPTGTKGIFVITISIYLLSFFSPYFIIYLYCSPDLILKFQVWRMFTTQFVEPQILNLFFSLLSLSFTAVNLERSIGTISFIVDFFFKNFLIQLLHFTFILFLNLAKLAQTVAPSFGLFNIIILYMSLRCYSDPESVSNFMCFPIQLRNKYQPIAMIILFCLIGGGVIRFDFVSAIIIGYVEVRFYGGMMLRLSQPRIESLRSSFLFKNLTTRPDFVEPNSQFLAATRTQQQTSSSSSSTGHFQGRGVTIGGPVNPPPQSRPNQQQHVINPSQQQQQQEQSEQQQGGDFQQFTGKGVSIGGGDTALSIQKQRELQLKRIQQQQAQDQSGDTKLEMDTNVDSSNDSSNQVIRTEQKNQQKKDGYTTLNEDLL